MQYNLNISTCFNVIFVQSVQFRKKIFTKICAIIEKKLLLMLEIFLSQKSSSFFMLLNFSYIFILTISVVLSSILTFCFCRYNIFLFYIFVLYSDQL